jgi:hypothetical protein
MIIFIVANRGCVASGLKSRSTRSMFHHAGRFITPGSGLKGKPVSKRAVARASYCDSGERAVTPRGAASGLQSGHDRADVAP